MTGEKEVTHSVVEGEVVVFLADQRFCHTGADRFEVKGDGGLFVKAGQALIAAYATGHWSSACVRSFGPENLDSLQVGL